MKDKIMIAALIMVCAYIMIPQLAMGIDTSDLKIVVEEISPVPALPGSDLTLKVRIYNEGGATAYRVASDITVKSPFRLMGESADLEESSLCAGCSRDKTYYIAVESGAASGVYPIEVRVYEKDSAVSRKEIVNVNIKGIPDVVFEAEEAGNIRPGESFTVRMRVKNIGTGTAKKVKMHAASDEFIRMGSAIYLIQEIEPSEEQLISVSFEAADTIVPNTYNIPFLISYSDEQGVSFNATQDYGVKVVHGAKLGLQSLKIDGDEEIFIGDRVEIQARIENIGTGDAENVKIILEGDMEGTKTTFIGRIKRDDDSPAFFTVVPKKSGDIPLTIRIMYEDDFGAHEFTEKTTVTVGQRKGNNMAFIPFLVVAAGGAGFYFFKKKR